MATPTSSATSPSPPMTFLQPAPVTSQAPISPPTDRHEREQRDMAIKKILARARLGMVTRGLRARLSYASYKATHNVVHASLPDLEARTLQQAQTTSFSRTIAAKRKAAGTTAYNTSSYSQGSSGATAGAILHRRTTSGTMAPPSAFASTQTFNSTLNGHNATSGNNNTLPASRSITNSGLSLYTSILAPPPSKQARTILNAHDPPVAAPTRPSATPRLRGTKAPARSLAESTRSHGRGRHGDHTTRDSGSPTKRKSRRSLADKGKQKQKAADVDIDADGDVDLKAAATLTSLLLNHRSTKAGSASSPRSSLDGSDAGSAYSYSHFAQSSTRTTTNPAPLPAHASTSNIESPLRTRTPPSLSTPAKGQHTTPGPAPTDSEAANLMLYLATSPSPARPSGKDSRDLAAYQALAGGSSALREKGRVLFPGFEEIKPSSARTAAALTRGEDSFNSSISSIGADMGMKAKASSLTRTATLPLPASLLPPASMPLVSSTPPPTLASKDSHHSPRPIYSQGSGSDFNFHDFINASPSPIRNHGHTHKASLGLRADVSRKLFQEEKRHAQNASQRPEERGLAASIDLMQS
ncbi:hypothetical protein AX16_005424 [Volvariella volvacea WC 439]|nr:hypothetical protein AX16_005424 [Volvariella volvacea WC 439]